MPDSAVHTRPRKDNPFVRELERLINASDKTQIDIAEEIGYDNHNMMTMFKRGATRVPLEKVAPLAEAIDADPAKMLKLWFETYMPGALETISKYSSRQILTATERSWVKGLREEYGEQVPAFERRLLHAGERLAA